MKLFENLVAEAGADVADVPPCIVFAYRQHEGAEEGPSSPRRGEAGDHDLLPLRGLHLQPIGGPASGRVRAVGALGHDAFEMSPLGFCEELRAVAFAVVAERDQLVARQDGLEPLLALEKRQRPFSPTVRPTSSARRSVRGNIEACTYNRQQAKGQRGARTMKAGAMKRSCNIRLRPRLFETYRRHVFGLGCGSRCGLRS